MFTAVFTDIQFILFDNEFLNHNRFIIKCSFRIDCSTV